MIGLGTIINTLAVIAGGVIGLFLKSGIKPRFQQILMQANGLAVIFIGISGVMQHMLVIENNTISTQDEICQGVFLQKLQYIQQNFRESRDNAQAISLDSLCYI